MAVESQQVAQRMQAEWDRRARENAYHYIASDHDEWSEEDFDRSGRESVQGVVVEDLDRIAGGRDPKTMTALEIGCGAGRMTRALAEIFGQVHAVDVSGEMIEKARARLADLDNVHLHHTNGVDLTALGDAEIDFAMSFVVFQHIPELDVIRGYITEVARRLRPGGLFKFQAQGSPAVESMVRDTWTGARFSGLEAVRSARANQLRIERFSGVGEQYFWLWMRKNSTPASGPDPIELELLEAESEILNEALTKLGRDLLDLRWWSDRKLEELRAHIRKLYGSWAYRLGRRARLAPEPIEERDPR